MEIQIKLTRRIAEVLIQYRAFQRWKHKLILKAFSAYLRWYANSAYIDKRETIFWSYLNKGDGSFHYRGRKRALGVHLACLLDGSKFLFTLMKEVIKAIEENEKEKQQSNNK